LLRGESDWAEIQFTRGCLHGVNTSTFGLPDFAELNTTDKTVSVGLGVPNGVDGAATAEFSSAGTPIAVGKGPSGMVAADFNNDGFVDLAGANRTDSTVSILLNSGNATFLNNPKLTTGSGAQFIVAGDFNGDGKIDLATVNQSANSVSVYFGAGNGTFAAKGDSRPEPVLMRQPWAISITTACWTSRWRTQDLTAFRS
jgi:hypothetical protein